MINELIFHYSTLLLTEVHTFSFSDFLSLMFFFSVPGHQPIFHITFCCPVSLGSSWLWSFLRFPLSLMTWTVLKSNGQVFCRMSPNWDLSQVFSWLDWSYRFWGGRPQSKCYFHHTFSKVYTTNMSDPCWCWLWSPGWRSVCQVSPL